jgi:DNA-binding transcriptional LysR family regulator
MSLTDQGRRYYEEALEILNAVDSVEARIREGSGTVAGHLKINAPNSFGQMVIAPLLPKFLEAHPDIILSLSLDDRLIDMVEGGFDLSIRIRPSLPDSSLVARRIGTVRQRIFAAPSYLERDGSPGVPHDLLKHRIIGFLLANHLTVWHLHSQGDSFDIDLRPQIRVGSSLVLRDLLIAGQGIGTLPDFVSNGPESRGELVRVLPDYELPPPQVFAITAPQMGADGRVRAFIEYLQSALKGGTLQSA